MIVTMDWFDVEMNRVATEHPEIARDEKAFLHYQQCVIQTGDFDQGYALFRQDEEDLVRAMDHMQQTALDRAAEQVANHLSERAQQSSEVYFDPRTGMAWSRR